MRTPEQWWDEKRTYSNDWWVVAIQNDARLGMVPAFELKAIAIALRRFYPDVHCKCDQCKALARLESLVKKAEGEA